MFRKTMSVLKASMVLAAATVALFQLQGCGGGGGSGSSTTGTLKVAITDSPAFRDYSSVHINITKVMAVPAGKEGVDDRNSGLVTIAEFPDGLDVNILKLHFLQQVLGSAPLPAGNYNQVRLILSPDPAKNYFMLTGSNSQEELTTPSALQTGVKINGHFSVTPGVLTTILLDFDPNTAIVMRGHTGMDNLKPTGIRLMQVYGSLDTSASISGMIRTAPFVPFSSASVSIKPRGPAASAVSTGTVYANYSGAGVWKTPFVAYVPPNGTTAMPSSSYRVFIQGYRDSQLRNAIFQLYSSPLMSATSTGIDYPVPPNGIVTLTP